MTNTELMTIDAQTGETITTLALREVPAETLAAAHRAAAALQDVIRKKAKPVLFKGEQYLEFEDWQTVGRFYAVTAKAVSVEPVTLGDASGFKAVATAITAEGREISRAEALCLNDEANWKGKPIFQLASMAQTRACAKALRNVLAWVVVLAGYRGTPAEELPRDEPPKRRPSEGDDLPADAPPQKARTPRPSGLITKPQQERFVDIAKREGWSELAVKTLLQREHLAKWSQIPIGKYELLISELLLGPPEPPATDDEAPF